MKNLNNDSPLDIAIENDSPRNTEIMLRYMLQFESLNLSKLFVDKFPALLEMNLPAFNDYLKTCSFRTE